MMPTISSLPSNQARVQWLTRLGVDESGLQNWMLKVGAGSVSGTAVQDGVTGAPVGD